MDKSKNVINLLISVLKLIPSNEIFNYEEAKIGNFKELIIYQYKKLHPPFSDLNQINTNLITKYLGSLLVIKLLKYITNNLKYIRKEFVIITNVIKFQYYLLIAFCYLVQLIFLINPPNNK